MNILLCVASTATAQTYPIPATDNQIRHIFHILLPPNPFYLRIKSYRSDVLTSAICESILKTKNIKKTIKKCTQPLVLKGNNE